MKSYTYILFMRNLFVHSCCSLVQKGPYKRDGHVHTWFPCPVIINKSLCYESYLCISGKKRGNRFILACHTQIVETVWEVSQKLCFNFKICAKFNIVNSRAGKWYNTRVLIILAHLCTLTFGSMYWDLWIKDN